MTAPSPRFLAAIALLALCSFATIPRGAVAEDSLDGDIEEVLTPYSVTGQGAVAVVLGIDADGKVTTWGKGAYGQRRVDSEEAVKVDDLFLVASCGKSFTAAVWGVLVTRGLVKWTDTIASILTKHKISTDGISATYAGSTVAQLLAHRAGFSDNTDWTTVEDEAFKSRMEQVPPLTEPAKRTAIRREFALYSLQQEPGTKRGSYIYSNIGYNVAAWLSEVVSGQNWENMILDFFAKPMKMKVGFGLPYNKFPLDGVRTTGPVGQKCSGGVLSLPDYDWEAYSPYGVGSGGIYMRIGDLATWVAWHVRGVKGLLPAADYKNISKAAFAALHKPWTEPGADNNGNYALGWNNDTNPDRMSHDGSYAGFRSNMIGVTQEDENGNTMALAVSTNVSDDEEGTCTDTVGAVLFTLTDNLIKKYMPSVVSSRKRRSALDLSMRRDQRGWPARKKHARRVLQ